MSTSPTPAGQKWQKCSSRYLWSCPSREPPLLQRVTRPESRHTRARRGAVSLAYSSCAFCCDHFSNWLLASVCDDEVNIKPSFINIIIISLILMVCLSIAFQLVFSGYQIRM